MSVYKWNLQFVKKSINKKEYLAICNNNLKNVHYFNIK